MKKKTVRNLVALSFAAALLIASQVFSFGDESSAEINLGSAAAGGSGYVTTPGGIVLTNTSGKYTITGSDPAATVWVGEGFGGGIELSNAGFAALDLSGATANVAITLSGSNEITNGISQIDHGGGSRYLSRYR